MGYRKKLIEVSLPLEALNEALRVENSKRHGKMSTIHPYWARRPQSSCRTLLWATLVDDPSSWPEIFKTPEDILAERKRLYEILIDLAQWDNMANKKVLYKAKYEIVRSIAREKNLDISDLTEPDDVIIDYSDRFEEVDTWLGEHGPSVHDPFCGGGSVPLEAFRLGVKAVATDLNPLAIMITKSTVEIPSRFPIRHLSTLDRSDTHTSISRDLQYFGQRLLDLCDDELSPHYPKFKVTEEVIKRDPHLKDYLGQEFTVLAWLWARTFPTSNPAYNGAQVPTIRSQCLSKKKGYCVQIDVDDESYDFRVVGPDATPCSSDDDGNDGTMTRTGAKCLLSGTLLPFSYLREQALSGNMDKKMMAIVLEGKKGRLFASPTQDQIDNSQVEEEIDKPMTNLPESALGFSVQGYGMDQHWKLFEPRQLKAISTLYSKLDTVKEDIIREMTEERGWPIGEKYSEGGSEALAYSEAIVTLIAMTVSKLSDLSCNLSRWESKAEAVQQLFARQTVSMVWDFAESNILSNSRGSYSRALKSTSSYFEQYIEPIEGSPASVFNQDAASVNPDSETVFFTDPPYYDNIGYADLSDFFYSWLSKYLGDIHDSVFSTILTPKTEELVATPKRNGTKDEAEQFFLDGMTKVINNLSTVGSDEFPISFYYAFKQQEIKDGMRSSKGWVTFLQSIIDSGLEVVRTFPSRTEHSARLITMGKAGLSTNVILVCRKRLNSKSIRRSEFISELKSVLTASVEEMQESGISPIDLTQAAIGPGISVYSKYESVMEVDGSYMDVRSALEIINDELSKILEETEDGLDSESRVCLKWFLTKGFSPEPYGDLDNLLRSTNTSSKTLEESNCMVIEGGKARIVEVESYPELFNKNDAGKAPAWAHVHRLIRLLNVRGENEAADYMRHIPSHQRDSVRSLTYRLYQICDDKMMMEQAKDYNALAISWGQIADRSQKPAVSTQVSLDEF
ncbi:MAG: hypothetical protein CL984_00010 [Euryarchaeota archaeon]|nr:hypothetical protein [Euryarchaeota archaeon]